MKLIIFWALFLNHRIIVPRELQSIVSKFWSCFFVNYWKVNLQLGIHLRWIFGSTDISKQLNVSSVFWIWNGDFWAYDQPCSPRAAPHASHYLVPHKQHHVHHITGIRSQYFGSNFRSNALTFSKNNEIFVNLDFKSVIFSKSNQSYNKNHSFMSLIWELEMEFWNSFNIRQLWAIHATLNNSNYIFHSQILINLL